MKESPAVDPVPTPLSSRQFKHHVRIATDEAMRDFMQRVQQHVIAPSPVAKKMRDSLREEYDWKQEEFSVKETVDRLILESQTYTELAEELPDADALYAALEEIADGQISELTFSSNNYPEAAMRCDLFSCFTRTVSEELCAAGLIAQDDTRFKDLINGYNCALHGYLDLREIVHDRTDEKFSSLLEWAASEVGEDPSLQGEAKDEAAAFRMMDHYRQILAEHGLANDEKGLVPVQLLYFSRWAERIAVRMAKHDHPYSADANQIAKASLPYYEKLLDSIVRLHDGNVASATRIEKLLEEVHAKAFGLPVDTRALMEQAGHYAHAQTTKAMPRLMREGQMTLRQFNSSGRKYMEQQGVEPYQPPLVDKVMTHWCKDISAELADENTIEGVIALLEQDADAAVHEACCGLEHPAILLARGEYAEHFGKQIVATLKKQGLPTREVAEAFAAVAAKYDSGLEAYQETCRWAKQDSNGAYGNFGEWALMGGMAQLGKDYTQLTREDKEKIPVMASHLLVQAAEAREVPEAWCGHPYLPLFYRLAVEHTAHTRMREIGRHRGADALQDLVVSDRHADGQWSAQEQQTVFDARQVERDVQKPRVAELLRSTMGMFPADEPDPRGLPSARAEAPEMQAPYVDCRTLKAAMEFFDTPSMQRRS